LLKCAVFDGKIIAVVANVDKFVPYVQIIEIAFIHQHIVYTGLALHNMANETVFFCSRGQTAEKAADELFFGHAKRWANFAAFVKIAQNPCPAKL